MKTIHRFIVILILTVAPLAVFSQDGPPINMPSSVADMANSSGSGGVIIQVKGTLIEGLTGTFSATFQGSPVRDVFRVFAQQTSLNIIVSPRIQANITATFKDASIKDAFLAILSANNLYYLEQGNIVKILMLDEYRNELQRAYLQTRIFDASIIDLNNVATVVKPLLTPGVGNMTVDASSSRIIVTDVPDNFPRIEKLILEISTPPRMVEIETKIVQVNLEDGNEVGIQWNALNIGDAVNVNFNYSADSGVADEALNVTGDYTFPDTPISVNALISMLALDYDVKVIASPRVIAVNRGTASIHIGSKVPYIKSIIDNNTTTQTTSQVEFTDVGIKLQITPMVTPDGFVRLKIEANQSSYQFVAITATENAPQIITTEVNCEAVVRDGQTVIIGGLIQEDNTQRYKSVPFLGRIPILKYLFSHSYQHVNRTELAIFLTPHVIIGGESNLSQSPHSQILMEAAGITNTNR